MANLTVIEPTYAAYREFLGSKDERPLGHNTRAVRLGDSIGIRYHDTFVVTFRSNGEIVLDSGGWRTVTTKQRMNAVTPLSISSDQGVWHVSRRANDDEAGYWVEISEFYDGLTVTEAGDLVSEPLIDSGREMKAMKRRIRKYTNLYTNEEVARLVADAAENGTGGDCWFCGMFVVGTGENLGVANGDTEHLLSHIEEGYTMASLALNAVKHAGYRDPGFILHAAPDLVRKSIYRMLTETLTVSHGARPARAGMAEHWMAS